MTDYTNWPLIGHGEERWCYMNPDDPTRMVKFSPIDHANQTKREIQYFNELIKKGIPFDYIPKYYGEVHEKDRLGIEQEYITRAPGSSEPALTINKYVEQSLDETQIKDFRRACDALKNYLVHYNVIPANLSITNVVVSQTENGLRLVIVDGVGGTEFIPIANWFRYFGRKKIERRWKKMAAKLNRINPKLQL